jgi:hypothetical protein
LAWGGADSAMMRAFIRVKIRSSSVIPANSAVSASVMVWALCFSRRVSRRAWRSSVNLNRLRPRTCWIWMPESIHEEG